MLLDIKNFENELYFSDADGNDINDENDLNLSQVTVDNSRKQITKNKEVDFKLQLQSFAVIVLLDTSNSFESLNSQYDRVFYASIEKYRSPSHLFHCDYVQLLVDGCKLDCMGFKVVESKKINVKSNPFGK